MLRIQGSLCKLPGAPRLSPADTVALISPYLNEAQVSQLSKQNALDTVLEIRIGQGQYRFRCNFFVQRKGIDAVMRLIPDTPPDLEELGLPKGLEHLVENRSGIVLVTGPSGCGKTSTIAALLHHLNKTRHRHIITLERPIEYIHHPIKSAISQREVPRDTASFMSGLRSALREAPDVILVGELTDLETTSMAMSAAETGHLVLATMHTSNTTSTIDRVVGSFPSSQQSLMRVMLAESLRGIISQYLFTRADGPGRVVAAEILFTNPAVSNLIRDNRSFQIPGVIETGASMGMQLMDTHLLQLLENGLITPRAAFLKANNKSRFESFMEWAL